MNSFWHQGYQDYPDISNPYDPVSPEGLQWQQGWVTRFFEEQQEDRKHE